ncbi:DEAD/DEAH box helicase [Haliscomenobacter sp.]|uniref:DEAD/DEAH box helicase n=1 Tax=Haliscomenobacter sp. TaxID=2717303 RepID=UPI003BACC771
MINFSKRMGSGKNIKPTNPIELYDTLDRESDKGPLRPSQLEILTTWYTSRKNEKDLIIKLHTGQGKTLIGLLILQSRLNEDKGPVVFVCPNIYLADQTREQAKQFGIKTCDFDSSNNLPDEFWNSTAILITHVQKMFNGATKFGLGNQAVTVNTIILDDCHSCIDTIEEASSITIPRTSNLYDAIISIFKESLEAQGYAKLQEIIAKESNEVMFIPYWTWQDRFKEVVEEIIKYKSEHYIFFSWPLIKDTISNCTCYVSSNSIEIKPYMIPIDMFGTFHRAEHRIMMSATTNNDAFFIKGLGLDQEVILNPLMFKKEKWSGEKMILIPYQIDDRLNRTEVVNWLASERKNRSVGIVALTPSFNDGAFWEDCGAELAKTETVGEKISQLKSGNYDKVIVFANRYDGIDLPDNSCRILIIDNKPYSQTLYDKYQEEVRLNSQIISIKVAQKIEQGLGRGVRGEKDYCVIILTGGELVSFIKNPKFKRFFSPQTQQQINIGMAVTKFAIEDAGTELNSKKIINEAINQLLRRDEGWKGYYKEQMDAIKSVEGNESALEILQLERKAEEYYRQEDFPKAKDCLEQIINKYLEDESEKGWYYQEMARLVYPMSKQDSNKLQVTAHRKNRSLLKPQNGMFFKKLEVDDRRVEKIIEYVQQFDNYSDLKSDIETTLGHLDFHPDSKRFELSLEKVGLILGFASERPEESWKEGPDNLWCLSSGKYLVIECKTGTKTTRSEINQNEAEQLLNSTRWFEEKYLNCNGVPVMIINTIMLARGAFLPANGKILTQAKLSEFKSRIRNFFNEFSTRKFDQLSGTVIQEWLNTYDLNEAKILSLLSSPKYHKS